MQASRRCAIVALVVCGVGLAGCQSGPDVPTPEATTTPTTSSPAPLALPGQARQAVNALLAAADGYPVIKVEVSSDDVTLSVVRDGAAVTYAYRDGEIKQVESSTQYFGQASFEPSDFAIDDVSGLFQQAELISGSTANQELQIVEYNNSQVLMTVTTRPESQTVFFRPDGTPIGKVDVTTPEGLSEALDDALQGAVAVRAIGYDPTSGLWVDVAGTEAGTAIRRTRPAQLPTWSATRRDVDVPLFSENVVDRHVLADLIHTWGAPDAANIKFVIDLRHRMPAPTITWQIDGQTLVTDIVGVDLTDAIP